MNPIEDIYKPFDYSASRCYVVVLTITQKGYMKLEHKLPSYVKQLVGVFITTTLNGGIIYAGLASLNFNGDAFKSIHLPVYKSFKMLDGSTRPMPLNESIKPNSFLQGYYLDMSKTNLFPYTVSIYLHYTPVP